MAAIALQRFVKELDKLKQETIEVDGDIRKVYPTGRVLST